MKWSHLLTAASSVRTNGLGTALAACAFAMSLLLGAGTAQAQFGQPTAVIVPSPIKGTVGVELTFDGSQSVDNDGTIGDRYHWVFGDESPDAFGVMVTHTYVTDGVFNLTLTVTDDDGATYTFSQTISVVSESDNTGPPAGC